MPGIAVSDDRGRITDRLKYVQIGLGVTLDLRLLGEEKNEWIAAPLDKLPCNHQPIAPVVSLATQNCDREFAEIVELILESLDDTHTGVFHQDDARNSVLLGGEAIDLPNLLGRQDFHIWILACISHRVSSLPSGKVMRVVSSPFSLQHAKSDKDPNVR